MAKRKDTFKSKDNSFEAGYNQEPVVEEEKQVMPEVSEQPTATPIAETPVAEAPAIESPVEETPVVETPVVAPPAPKAPAKKATKSTRAKKAPVAEPVQETSEGDEFDPLTVMKRTTIYLNALQREMLRIYCFKRNMNYTEWHSMVVDEFFKDYEDIKAEAIYNVQNGIAK